MTNEVYHLIKSLKKVSGFLGPQGKPSPISEEEVTKSLETWKKVLQTHHLQ
jgi:transcriptional antiterminator NusG